MVPIWITVKVPPDVPAGKYAGSVKVEAEGEKPVQVPIELRVADWSLPDTQDFRTWVDMIQCPDTLALEYNVPLWSEKHWELIAQSFRLIGETGSRTVYVPLIAHTNLGNEESMVRWVKKGDKYDYDFSIMERYLDVAEKNMGKPKLVDLRGVGRLHDPAPPTPAARPKSGSRQKELAEHVQKTGGHAGTRTDGDGAGPGDGEDGTGDAAAALRCGGEQAAVAAAVRPAPGPDAQAGLEDKLMLGLQSDAWASKEEHQFFKDITGGLPWVIQSHEGFVANLSRMRVPENKLMHGISKIGYQARVWAVTFSDDNADRGRGYEGGLKSHRGWSRPDLVAQFDRFSREISTNVYWHHLAETAITGSQRGNGRLGADYWKVMKNKKGKRVGAVPRPLPGEHLAQPLHPRSAAGPGPDGPVASDEMEAYREGVQECEARIVIERALSDEALKAKLGADLVRRCEEYLQDRHMMMWLSLSDLQLFYNYPGAKWGPSYMASSWRGRLQRRRQPLVPRFRLATPHRAALRAGRRGCAQAGREMIHLKGDCPDFRGEENVGA